MQLQKILVVLLYHVCCPSSSSAALLAATDPKFLQDMEASMAKIARDYVELEKSKLELLSQHAEKLEARSKGHTDAEHSPTLLYRTVESLTDEWNSLYETMNSTSLGPALQSNPPTPKFQDLQEIATAIFRMQDVYQFSATDVASGAVKGLDAGNFTARDCFNLAGIAYARGDHYHALMWYDEARSRAAIESPPSIAQEDISPLLALSMAKKGNQERAKQLIVEFDTNASRDTFWHVMHTYPDLNQLLEDAKKGGNVSDPLPPLKNDRLDWYDTTEQPKYELLCRQEYKKEYLSLTSNYTCHYDRKFPHMYLAPAKVELMRTDPPVVIYRQMISDSEISTIKSISRKKMERSRVSEQNAGGIVLNSARESFTAWLRDIDHPVVAAVRKRVGLFTGLSMDAAEDLQVTEYGIGGHYGPHYDHATKEARSKPNYAGSFSHNSRDRIATLMFYLAEPAYGGATAFPYANLVVKPTKNDAIFWYNIRRSGEGDYNTLHAGCPVVSGSKWVANEWIKEKGQEFIRLCALSDKE